MHSLFSDSHFALRFTDDRIVPRFHLEGVEAGRQVSVFRLDHGTGDSLGMLVTATAGEGGCPTMLGLGGVPEIPA